MSLDRERDQVMRDIYPEPSDDERFYAKALSTLTRPRRLLRTIGLVANVAVYGLWACAGAFLVEQAWDRLQPPFEYRSAIARPASVRAGEPVHVVVDIERYQRCTYAVTWSVTDAAHMVTTYGPLVERAPGEPGHDTYSHAYQTPPSMAPGPATLRVTLRGECDDNYVDNWLPRVIDMPAVAFTVEAAPPHDAAPVPRP